MKNAIGIWPNAAEEVMQQANRHAEATEVNLQAIKQELVEVGIFIHNMQKLPFIKTNIIDSTGFLNFAEEFVINILKEKSKTVRGMMQSPEIMKGLIEHLVLHPLANTSN
jgi:hypothetical protein